MTRLKESSVNLHSNSRLTLIVTASYVMLSFLIVAIVMTVGNTNLGRLITLNKCNYQYSATMGKSNGKDEYYLFEAGIGFTSSKESNRGINAEILMQVAESDYTDSVNWNANNLSIYEIAISEDLARKYGLKVGSALYARHIVDGNLYEYTVTQLLPYFPGTGISGTNSYSDGVIIMGYDSKYEQNISHTTIFFTNELINDLISEYSEVPVNIVYRDDLIASTKEKLVPYLILLGVLGIVITLAFIYVLLHVIICDYKRLIMLGFRKRDLDMAFCIYTFLPFTFSSLCIVVLSVGLIYVLDFCREALWFSVVLLLVELITFVGASFMAMWRVWRA